jgi:hypothetical protein
MLVFFRAYNNLTEAAGDTLSFLEAGCMQPYCDWLAEKSSDEWFGLCMQIPGEHRMLMGVRGLTLVMK